MIDPIKYWQRGYVTVDIVFSNIFVKYGDELKRLLWPVTPKSKQKNRKIPMSINDLERVISIESGYKTVQELIDFIRDEKDSLKTKQKYRLEYRRDKSKMYLCHDFVNDLYAFFQTHDTHKK